MTAPAECVDAAFDVITAFITALREAFDPASDCPPADGSVVVRFVAGDTVPLELWDAHAEGDNCEHPFLWVRVVRRYRTRVFPEPAIVTDCDLARVMHIEIGVGRCAALGESVDWKAIADEAEVSLDDSWRIELALCRARGLLDKNHYRVGTGTIEPYGPEGGVSAWAGTAYVQF